MAIAMLKPLLEYTWILKIQDFLALTLIFSVLSFILYIDPLALRLHDDTYFWSLTFGMHPAV